MGCTETRAQPPELLYRTKSIRNLILAKQPHESGSFSSVIEDSRESSDSHRKTSSLVPKRGSETHLNRLRASDQISKIDIKEASRIRKKHRKSVFLQLRGQVKTPGLARNVLSPLPSVASTQVPSSAKLSAVFEENDLNEVETVCVQRTSVFNRQPFHKETGKATRSTYKLFRANRQPSSWDPAMTEGNEVSRNSLVGFLRNTTDNGRGNTRHRSVKQLITSDSNYSSARKIPIESSLFESIVGKQEETERGRPSYMIKTPHAFRFPDTGSSFNTQKAKSRAERMWAWRGGKGTYGVD